MLYDKYPYEKSGRGDRQCQSDPIGNVQAEVHEVPGNEKRDKGVANLPDTLPEVRVPVSGNDIQPGRFRTFWLIHFDSPGNIS